MQNRQINIWHWLICFCCLSDLLLNVMFVLSRFFSKLLCHVSLYARNRYIVNVASTKCQILNFEATVLN